jgi:hypothetical protein
MNVGIHNIETITMWSVKLKKNHNNNTRQPNRKRHVSSRISRLIPHSMPKELEEISELILMIRRPIVKVFMTGVIELVTPILVFPVGVVVAFII